MPVPERGDIIYLDFNPKTGKEQAERQLAIVLSPQSFNQTTGYASVCPISQTARKIGLPRSFTCRFISERGYYYGSS